MLISVEARSFLENFLFLTITFIQIRNFPTPSRTALCLFLFLSTHSPLQVRFSFFSSTGNRLLNICNLGTVTAPRQRNGRKRLHCQTYNQCPFFARCCFPILAFQLFICYKVTGCSVTTGTTPVIQTSINFHIDWRALCHRSFDLTFAVFVFLLVGKFCYQYGCS